jgi:polar amino acid transport system permease protein
VFNFGKSVDFAAVILHGVIATVELTVFSCLLALVAAFIAGLALLSKHATIRCIARSYVEVLRGTSVFVQLFAAYFILPLMGLTLTPVEAAVLALGLNGGAYGAEVVRSGIQAVGRDQTEATIAVNLTRFQAMRWIIIPQALVLMLPSFGNLAIEIMKGTAVASLITVSELTFQAQTVRSQTGDTAFPFLSILIIYLVIASALMIVVRWIERRYRRGLTA